MSAYAARCGSHERCANHITNNHARAHTITHTRYPHTRSDTNAHTHIHTQMDLMGLIVSGLFPALPHVFVVFVERRLKLPRLVGVPHLV